MKPARQPPQGGRDFWYPPMLHVTESKCAAQSIRAGQPARAPIRIQPMRTRSARAAKAMGEARSCDRPASPATRRQIQPLLAHARVFSRSVRGLNQKPSESVSMLSYRTHRKRGISAPARCTPHVTATRTRARALLPVTVGRRRPVVSAYGVTQRLPAGWETEFHTVHRYNCGTGPVRAPSHCSTMP